MEEYSNQSLYVMLKSVKDGVDEVKKQIDENKESTEKNFERFEERARKKIEKYDIRLMNVEKKGYFNFRAILSIGAILSMIIIYLLQK